MSVISPAFLLLALLMAIVWLFAGPAIKAAKQARMDLTADELKTFEERYRRANSRADMPSRFTEIARATDRASRIWLGAVVAVLAALVWITMAGPGLGLFPYP